jgi:hypothetical protein
MGRWEMYESLDISCSLWTYDLELFSQVIEQDIDAYLEAFVESKFKVREGRLYMTFHPDEVQILLRRLCEIYDRDLDNVHVGLWIEDIMKAQFGYEVM